MNLTPKLIIFDLDGTLIDSAPDLALAVDATLGDFALPPAGEAKARHWIGNGASKLVERALADAGADSIALATALEHFHRHYLRLCNTHTRPYPGVVETLQQLSQQPVTLAIATNKPARYIQPILEHLEISQFFAFSLGGDELPVKKPDPAPLRWCMEKAGVAPEQTLMVGDSINDIEAANNAQVPVLAVSYGYNHGVPVAASSADKVIANFPELLDTLNFKF